MLSISRVLAVKPLGPVQLHVPPLAGQGPRLTEVVVEDTVAALEDGVIQAPLTSM
jgi:hypothetical protein